MTRKEERKLVIMEETETFEAPSDSGEDRERFLGLLRDIRVEAQYLQKSLVNISTKDSNVRIPDDKSFELLNKTFIQNKKRIKEHLESLQNLLDHHGVYHDYYGDDVSHIVNLWNRICLVWEETAGEDNEFDQYSEHAEELLSLLSEVIYHSNLVTIPHRVDQHFETLRIGQAFDFHQVFAEEMPLLKDERQIHEQSFKILHYIHSHPGIVDGIVDIENGLIYKASNDSRRRAKSFLYIALVMLAGALLFSFVIPCLRIHLEPENWPAFTSKELLGSYLFVVTGAVAHIGVDALKQYRANKEKSFTALEDCLLWIHTKELPLIVGALSLYVVFLILVFSGEIEWQISFFAGYGADSVIDVFLQRFSSVARAKIPVQ